MLECPSTAIFVGSGSDPSEPSKHLLENCLAREDGVGAAIDVGTLQSRPVVIRLEIDHTVEHKSLSLSIWGSVDGVDWGDRPLVTLPPKTYCGGYLMRLDLSQHPEVRYLRAGWKMSSWHQTNTLTLFGFSVLLEPSGLGGHQPDDSSEQAVSAGAGVSRL